MRFGAPVPDNLCPDEWIATLKSRGYTAAYLPLPDERQDDTTLAAYATAAKEANIVIAEVGAWTNPLSKDESERKAAIGFCQERLAIADRVGARCCVNIAGSRSSKWDGPHSENLTPDTFDLIVQTVREIIDAVKPVRTFYSLEPMPWMYPDSIDSYQRLIRAIQRPQFAVHFDPVNLISSPQLYYQNGNLIREFCRSLGPYIRSCHVKDIILRDHLTIHLDEVRPGLGNLDYVVLLQEINRLDPDTPLLLEHLPSQEEYELAAAHIRSVAENLNLRL